MNALASLFKAVLILTILLLAAYGAYTLYQEYVQPPPPPPAPAVAPQPQVRTIVCRTCAGRGRLVDISKGTQIGYSCPICRGVGKKTVPADAEMCDYCGGWGLVPRPSQNKNARVLADKCPMCRAATK